MKKTGRSDLPIRSSGWLNVPVTGAPFKIAARIVLFAPSLLLVLLFRYYPALRSLEGSLTSWNGFSQPIFVGLTNFAQYLTQPLVLVEIFNLALLVAGGVVTQVLVPFAGAEMVVALPRGWIQSSIKYLLVVPMVIPQVVLIDVWAYLLNPSLGPVDAFLSLFKPDSTGWFGDPHTALLSILLIGFPWVSSLAFLVFLAGLQTISAEIYDAGQLDGTGTWRRILSIDAPLCIPQFRFVSIIAGVGIIQNFIPILLLTNGGPGNATMIPALDMYDNAFQYGQLGYGMAIGTLLFVILLVLSLMILRWLKPRT